ncbi:leucyl aminopeptidase [Glaciibacter flavus]|uniref:Probable cytosol aminopeptidase n=1 Tax=Orlajensenia flava TaxID=2565934 RepID=A0A4S4FXT7_9MICO|nr:leucyl aminopeptidase [Glaciibacter flavus]THG35111.1 leucyl aminopeptidase [Glaciibacter flavus]
MTSPELTFSTADPSSLDAEVIVIGARRGEDGPELVAHAAYAGAAEHLSALGVTGAPDQLIRAVDPTGRAGAVAIVGLGGTVDSDALRVAGGSAIRQLAGTSRVAFAIPADGAGILALAEGAALGSYAFTAFRHASLSPSKEPVAHIEILTDDAPTDAERARILAVERAVTLVRDLVNTPPADLAPADFADRAQQVADQGGLTATVWSEDELVEQGFGGIIGVGKGSTRPPRLVKVSYSPDGATQHLALVGKGITFDSGGLSLKPAASMQSMKSDMTGAAVVLAVIAAAAEIGVPLRMTAWMCLAENMPSGSAMRPDDVLRIRGGRTVEVTNTDAEGRLVLADGLVAAGEEHPDAIIDVATLTGAQVVALGHSYSAVMGDDAIVEQVLRAAKTAGEPFWPMPLPDDLLRRLDSDVADLKNATPGDTAAGMLLAGVFLREFIGRSEDGSTTIPWAHLDIAGTAMLSGKPRGHSGSGATGVAVRTLLALAEAHRAE